MAHAGARHTRCGGVRLVARGRAWRMAAMVGRVSGLNSVHRSTRSASERRTSRSAGVTSSPAGSFTGGSTRSAGLLIARPCGPRAPQRHQSTSTFTSPPTVS